MHRIHELLARVGTNLRREELMSTKWPSLGDSFLHLSGRHGEPAPGRAIAISLRNRRAIDNPVITVKTRSGEQSRLAQNREYKDLPKISESPFAKSARFYLIVGMAKVVMHLDNFLEARALRRS